MENYFKYDKASPESFDWLRFGKKEYPGFTMYFVYSQRPYHEEGANYPVNMIQARCLIHTQEAYNFIKPHIETMIHKFEHPWARTEQMCISSGLRGGCFEWKYRTQEERDRMEEEYRSNPPPTCEFWEPEPLLLEGKLFLDSDHP